MAAFFLLCTNIGSVLSLLQGLDWLKNHGHTDKPVAQQLTALNDQLAKKPTDVAKIVNSTPAPADTK